MPGYPNSTSVTVTDVMATIDPAVGNVAKKYVWLVNIATGVKYGPSAATDSSGNWSLAAVDQGIYETFYAGESPVGAVPTQWTTAGVKGYLVSIASNPPPGVGPPSQSIVYFGDSQTSQMGGNAAQPYLHSRGFGTWAQVLSGHRLKFLNDSGAAGVTTANMLAVVQTDVIAYKPGWCHILGGTNDVGNYVGGTGATAIAAAAAVIEGNLQSIYTLLQNAGIQMIIGTIPAKDGMSTGQASVLHQVNQWIRTFARANPNIMFVDYFALTADPAGSGGFWTGPPTRTFDGLHPSITAAAVMGKALAAIINQYVAPLDRLSSANSDSTNFITNGRFQGAQGNGLATTWILVTGAATFSKVNRSDDIPGQYQRIVVPVGGACQIEFNVTVDGTILKVGDFVTCGLEFKTSGIDPAPAANAQGFYVGVKPYNGSIYIAWSGITNELADLYWDSTFENMGAPPAAGNFETPYPFAIPATTTILSFIVHMTGGGTYDIDRAFLRKP